MMSNFNVENAKEDKTPKEKWYSKKNVLVISFCLCKTVVVFLIQDVIYAVLTEHFHNSASASTNNTATTNTDHLIGLFNGKFLENEWFWLIIIISLTFFVSQVCKLSYKIKRDTQNKDSIEKLKEIAEKNFNPIKELKALLESENGDIEKLQEKKKEAHEFC